MFTLSERAIFLLNAKELNVIVVLALSKKISLIKSIFFGSQERFNLQNAFES